MSRLPLNDILKRFDETQALLSNTTDPKELEKYGKEFRALSEQKEFAQQILKNEASVESSKAEIDSLGESDSDLNQMLSSDIAELTSQNLELENKLLSLLSPSDPRDEDDILLEIRAGAGGDESAIFAGDIYTAYSAMASSRGLKTKIISASQGTHGGFKEIIAEIRGRGAFKMMKYEGGVHRVQRVPDTEKQGRIHTSTISVAIMPLIEENNDFKLNPSDIEIILSTSGGKGGQSVNTTYSAVKMKHIPTGMEAQSQDERDQQQNRIKALNVLTSRVYDFYEQKRMAEEMSARREQVGNADRSEKIRTYNFPQDRLTDHRHGLNFNQLPVLLSGDFYRVVEAIAAAEAEKTLASLSK
jgi:peptide chain release factor 1